MGVDPNKNFDIVNKLRRNCPPGYQKRYLNPEEKCSDQFTIGTGKCDYFLPCICFGYVLHTISYPTT